MNRFTAYILFPGMGLLAVLATPVFHALFGTKWDASIILFQLLLFRGVFTVLTSLYNNYAIALARTGLVVRMEIVRDVVAFLFLALTYPYIARTAPDDPVWGIRVLLYGQIVASVATWVLMAVKCAPLTGRSAGAFTADNLPYLLMTLVAMGAVYGESLLISSPWLLLIVGGLTGAGVYALLNRMFTPEVQGEVMGYLLRRRRG